MYIDSRKLYYIIAFILILALVFVEDIDILYESYMIPVVFILLSLTILFICRDSIGIGMLLISIFILVIIRYYAKKHFQSSFASSNYQVR
jgi:hypothetical protein